MIKVLLLGEAESAHTQKWANELSVHGLLVRVFSLFPSQTAKYNDKVRISSNANNLGEKSNFTSFKKIRYLKSLGDLKNEIAEFKPDILHSFYGSSYGFLGALSGFHPFCISLLGTDVLEFPELNFATNAVFKFTLSKADMLFATSSFLCSSAQKFTKKKVTLIPFGIDTNVFSPRKKNVNSDFTFGTLKNLEKYYSIHILLRAFAMLTAETTNAQLKLKIGGEGTEKQNLINEAKELGIDHLTSFTGFVPYSEAPSFHSSIDVHVTPSSRETFGVSILEASSCGVPVIASDIPGFTDTLVDGLNGLKFRTNDPVDLYNKMKNLLNDSDLMLRMSKDGREFVKSNFELSKNVNTLIKHYEALLN